MGIEISQENWENLPQFLGKGSEIVDTAFDNPAFNLFDITGFTRESVGHVIDLSEDDYEIAA